MKLETFFREVKVEEVLLRRRSENKSVINTSVGMEKGGKYRKNESKWANARSVRLYSRRMDGWVSVRQSTPKIGKTTRIKTISGVGDDVTRWQHRGKSGAELG